MKCEKCGGALDGASNYLCQACRAMDNAQWRNMPAERREREAAELRAVVRRSLLQGGQDPFASR